MRDVQISSEVRALLGDAVADQWITGPHPDRWRCQTCRIYGRVDTDGPVVVGVDVHHHGVLRVWLQHAGCGPGEIRVMDSELSPPAEVTAYGSATILDTETGLWPGFIVETAAARLTAYPGTVDVVDEVLATMLAAGMSPILSLTAPPPPPAEVVWQIQSPRVLDGRPDGGRIITHLSGEPFVLLEPLPDTLPAWWEAVAARGGHCVLWVASRIGLGTLDDTRSQQVLETAVAEGRMVGTTAVVT